MGMKTSFTLKGNLLVSSSILVVFASSLERKKDNEKHKKPKTELETTQRKPKNS